jgi:hypothetical protein
MSWDVHCPDGVYCMLYVVCHMFVCGTCEKQPCEIGEAV